MSALQVVEAEPVSADPLTRWLGSTREALAAAVPDGVDDGLVSAADRVDRIAVLERLRSTVAALQVAETVKLARARVVAQLEAGVPARHVGKGLAEEIGLACRISPTAGAKRLSVAKALWVDLPETFGLLTEGVLHEFTARMVVAETTHLDGAGRGVVDRKVVAAGIEKLGWRSAAACARKHAYETDPALYLERGRTERKNRRVSLRPAPDTMSLLTGFLPVEQGVSCLAALKRHTDTVVAAGDVRSRDQIMADTFVERLTGQARAEDVAVEVELMIPLSALTDPEDVSAATIPGVGPIPGPLARELLGESEGRKRWRRLFTDAFGRVVDGDRRSRRWTPWMTKLVRLRDQTCRDSYCDAPIRHLDHVHRWADGGPTTVANARGVCERGNHVRELPGWQVIPGTERDRAQVVTPTGHRYTTRDPDPP